MTFYQKFSVLCLQRGISPSKAAEEIGISKSNVSSWKSGGYTPRGKALNKIAQYFGISSDELLGNDTKKEPAIEDRLGPRGKEIYKKLQKIEAVNPDAYQQALDYLDFLIKRQDKKDK